MIIATEELGDGTRVRLEPDDGHGSMRGWRRHMKDGELPCPRCSRANSGYMRDWRARNPPGPAEAEAQRAASRARQRALRRLAREHPARFFELLEDENKRARYEAAS